MATGTSRKISAASARTHTRRAKKKNSFQLPSGIGKKILVVVFIGFLAWAYKATQPPPPKLCGTPGGPPITGPRIKLSDGRHLAYLEHGVPKETAKYRIVYVHAFESCRHDAIFATALSPGIIEDLGVYIVSFDRAGYGESDPNPKRTVKSGALDIEELADQLGLGSKFYIVGFSMGGQVLWGCLKYIPHRLAGAALVAPVSNYWWPGFPANLSREAYRQRLKQDQLAFAVSHYLPWLTYWWNTQKWFPFCSVIAHSPHILSRRDGELLPRIRATRKHVEQVKQQGEYVTLHQDMNIGFGSWEFDPMELENPLPNGEGSVHLWQGDEDLIVPASLQRFMAQKLPWIRYHELPGAGHFLLHDNGVCDAVAKALLAVHK